MKNLIKKLWHAFVSFCKMLVRQLKDPLNFLIFGILWLIFFSPWWFGYILFFVTGNPVHLTYSSAWLGFWSLPFTPALAFIIAMTFLVRKILKAISKKLRIKQNKLWHGEHVEKIITRFKRRNKLVK